MFYVKLIATTLDINRRIRLAHVLAVLAEHDSSFNSGDNPHCVRTTGQATLTISQGAYEACGFPESHCNSAETWLNRKYKFVTWAEAIYA